MIVKGLVKSGKYYDSVSLMLMAKSILKLPKILDAAAVMATDKNKEIVADSKMFLDEFTNATDNDLLLAVKAEDEKTADEALKEAVRLLEEKKKTTSSNGEFAPKSIEGAVAKMPESNLALISIAGKYAGVEADKALDNGLNVMLFSDNVSIETELKLKQKANSKGLIVMGPDCGTAIINGIPLAFANVVPRGNIGIVAASGTGLQEVSSIIANIGGGVSQAIGTGGRDIKSDIGGISFLSALDILKEDEHTKVVVLVSKPPASEVLEKIAQKVKNLGKPCVAIFLGADEDLIKKSGAKPAKTLEETAYLAVSLANDSRFEYDDVIKQRTVEICKVISNETKNKQASQKYLRGLFCGGTFTTEAQVILSKMIEGVKSNAPLNKDMQIEDSWRSKGNAIIDLGEDEFTVGRPHPMIDLSLRNRRILEEAENKDVAVILLDVVLGYGSNMNPADEMAPVIIKAKEIAAKDGRNISFIFFVTGTAGDPQNKEKTIKILQEAGAVYMPSNAAACELSGLIVKSIV